MPTIFNSILRLFLYTIPIFIDRKFRHLDHFLNNSYHPYRKRWRLNGHGPSILIIISYTVCCSLYGPTWDAVMAIFPSLYDTAVADFTWKNGLMFGFLTVLLLVVWLLPIFKHDGEHVRKFHLIVLIVIAFFILIFADVNATEADNTIYRHGFFVFGIILLLFSWISKILAKRLLKQFVKDNKQHIQKAFHNIELFKKPKKPTFLPGEVGHAALTTITQHPFHLLLLPSLLILFLKDVGSGVSYWLLAAALAFAFFLSFWGSLHPRWNNMYQLITRVFLHGGMLVVSIVVIALALARVFDVTYVTTVMDGTPLTVIPYAAAFYFYFLAFEYWANRSFNEELFPIFGEAQSYGRVAFDIDEKSKGKDIKISEKNRYLQFHGIDRFLVTGLIEGNKKAQYGYESYNRETLISRLLEYGIGQDDEGKRLKAREIFRRIRSLTNIYFSILNISLVLAVVLFFRVANYNDNQQAVWIAEDAEVQLSGQALLKASAQTSFQNNAAHFSLSDSLFQQAQADKPAILLASSGGGTRAALYTSSVLYGLHKLNASQHVLMGSGVSGGGVSLAYFAHHRDKLIDNKNAQCKDRYARSYDIFSADESAWECYFERISRPFIKDVIQGLSEWRISGGVSNGVLLAESLARNFSEKSEKSESSDYESPIITTKNKAKLFSDSVTFGQLKDFGLLLNTALVAHQYDYSQELSERYKTQPVNEKDFFIIHGGSRLIFTNLHETSGFPSKNRQLVDAKGINEEDIFLKYKIIKDAAMPLTTAGALNANFPPVFSNSLVKQKSLVDQQGKMVQEEASYFVTDGGAVENRGVISLLFSMKSAFSRYAKDNAGQCLPDIHMVVAEASASSIDYKNNRGLETALGGSLPVANGLYRELLKDVRQQYRAINKSCGDLTKQLDIHYLAMPRFFRTRGGMGTHWMMPSGVKFSNPNIASEKAAKKAAHYVNQSELEALIVNLYAAPESCNDILAKVSGYHMLASGKDRLDVCRWLTESKSQLVWKQLADKLTQ